MEEEGGLTGFREFPKGRKTYPLPYAAALSLKYKDEGGT
jgi:hypothetical protein